MSVSKIGLASLIIGLSVLAGSFFWKFSSAGILHGLLAMLGALLLGGLLWIGVFLSLIGILILLL